MDKSDVEMKDATEQLQDPNKELHPQNDSVDVQPLENDERLPHSAIVEDTKPSKLGTQDKLDGVTEPEDVVDAAKNTKNELECQNCKEIPNGLEMPTENVDKDQQLGGKTGEGQKIKENIELEKTPIEKEAVPTELTAEKASNNEKGVNSEVIERNEEPAGDEVLTRENEGMVNEPNQKIKDNSELETTLIEKGALPDEFTVEKASHHDTGINEEVKERKDEPTNDEVLTTENGGVINEPKPSEKMVDPPSSLEDGDTKKSKFLEAEREASDADQKSAEAMTDAPKDPVNVYVPTTPAVDTISSLGTSLDDQNPTTPPSMIKCSSIKSGGYSEGSCRNMFNEIKMPGGEDGTPEEQAAFMRELESFYRGRATEFKAPRFYGQQLNCLKLWRSVIKLGGYDLVTGTKLWRQVGESFHPPKTCTTVSWTFRIFYEKALLEYERHVTESGQLQLPIFTGFDPSSVDNEGSSFQASGSGRARRDSAARAMQGWHSRLQGNTDLGEQIMKDKNGNNMLKREKSIKSIGSLKQKRPDEVEHPVKAARTEPSKQLVTSVVDVGPPADWVRINVRETKDCYEVYALVPGLLREEVRVQSDPAGRLVITGQPDQPDNPWGITAFKKVVSLPGRIDPLHTSAVVSLHGRLFVRVPFEQ